MKPRTITKRQRELLTFVESYMIERGMPPTRQDISNHFGWNSPNTADEMLRRVAAKGYLKIKPFTSRGIELVDYDFGERDRKFVNWYKKLPDAERRDIRRLCLRKMSVSNHAA